MSFRCIPTGLPDVLILEPTVFVDARGSFHESYTDHGFTAATGLVRRFVQDNHSYSAPRVLRGLHYQLGRPQGKLIRVTRGSIWDVAVDLRRSSATFGRWVGVALRAEDHRQLWIPEGFAHGYYVTSDGAEVLYKTTEYWHKDLEREIRWNDTTLGITWPATETPLLSARDASAPDFADAEVFDASMLAAARDRRAASRPADRRERT